MLQLPLQYILLPLLVALYCANRYYTWKRKYYILLAQSNENRVSLLEQINENKVVLMQRIGELTISKIVDTESLRAALNKVRKLERELAERASQVSLLSSQIGHLQHDLDQAMELISRHDRTRKALEKLQNQK